MAVTMRDVAKKAGVSLKTVSRVINNEDNVTPETRDWVLKVTRELGFVPNLAARNLSRGKAMTIGVVHGWPLASLYSSTLAHFIQTECTSNGYNLAMFSMNENVTDQIVNAYIGKRIDGLILQTVPGNNTGLRTQLDNLQIPYLIVHPASMDGLEKTSYVTIDDRQSTKTAVEYLISLGHTSIGCLVGDHDYVQDQGRLNGYLEALADAGIPFRNSLVYREEPTEFSLGHSGALQLMANNEDLSAIFCKNDEVALGAMSAIWQSGRQVPHDISVIGFDDIGYPAMVIPPLTTIHQPIEQIAKSSVKHLIKLIEDPNTDRLAKTLPTSLIVRETCTSLK